jgi:hypothetical protein
MAAGSPYERELELFQSGKEETSSLRKDERDILDQQMFRKTLFRAREVLW